MTKSIFITGIAGFLGSHIADRMLERGYRVVGCDNFIGGYEDNIPDGVEFHPIDCNHYSGMVRITENIDTVYHCAATAYEGLSVFSPHVITKNIVGATTGILASAIQNRVRRIIYCSSMARYGTNEVPFRETYETRPQDPYGIGKVASEQLLKNLCEVHGVEWVIAVPHNIIGPRQKYDDPYRNVASIMINLMLQSRQPIIYGDGTQQRCFSFIQDDINVLDKLINDDRVVGEVINIGPDEEFITILKLAETIADLLNFDLKPIYMPGRPQEVKLANCSADKARELLGYKTEWSLRDGLAAMIDYIKFRKPKKFSYHLPLEIINEKIPATWKDRLF